MGRIQFWRFFFCETPVDDQSSAPEEQVEGISIDDKDLLDCPICIEPLCTPVYQCENGHLVCKLCRSKINNKCPSCRLPIGYKRCRVMEKFIESIKFSCKNLQYGCTAKLCHKMKVEHESTCSPCWCPYPGCEYVRISSCVYTHFTAMHRSNPIRYNSTIRIAVSKNRKHVFLQELNERTIFVINNNVEPFGCLVNVICIAPASSKKVIPYDLTAEVGDISVNFKSFVDVMPNMIEGSPARNFLIIPGYFVGSNGITRLELTLGSELKSLVSSRVVKWMGWVGSKIRGLIWI